MEARIQRFRELSVNPWFNVMNWVLDELRTPPTYRTGHAREGWVFYMSRLPRTTFMKRRLF
jgi:hypothetical protein